MEDFNKKEEKIFEEGINYAKKKALLARLRQKDKSMPEVVVEPARKRLSVLILKWGIAAGILLLLGIGLWLTNNNSGNRYDELFAKYFEPYSITGILRGDNPASLKSKALLAYQVEDYKKAIPLLEKLHQEKSFSRSQFYLSIAYLGDGQSTKAIENFIAFRQQSTELANEVNWYLALAYLKNGNIESIENLLLKMTGEDREKVKELIKKVKGIKE